MRVFEITLTSTAQSLKTLIGTDCPRHTGAVGLQAPASNTGTVYFGNRKIQPFELRPEANVALPVTNFDQVFVRGVGQLSVALFDG